jgi:beta-galactosidase
LTNRLFSAKYGLLRPADSTYNCNNVRFEIEGPAKLAAVASSKPNSVESFQGGKRKAFNGKGLAIIRAGYDAGKVSLKANSEGLESAQIEIELK